MSNKAYTCLKCRGEFSGAIDSQEMLDALPCHCITGTKSESDIKQEILEACGHGDVRLWNAPVGGMSIGDRFYRFGMGKGSSDLIGLKKRTITINDVGKTCGQFVAIEVKTDTGRATVEQLNFINAIRDFGGLSGIARSPGEAKFILGSWDTHLEVE